MMRGIQFQSDLIWYQSFRMCLSPGSSTNLIAVGYLVHVTSNLRYVFQHAFLWNKDQTYDPKLSHKFFNIHVLVHLNTLEWLKKNHHFLDDVGTVLLLNFGKKFYKLLFILRSHLNFWNLCPHCWEDNRK